MCAEWMIITTKKAFFGELMKAKPIHDTKQCWTDILNADLNMLIASGIQMESTSSV